MGSYQIVLYEPLFEIVKCGPLRILVLEKNCLGFLVIVGGTGGGIYVDVLEEGRNLEVGGDTFDFFAIFVPIAIGTRLLRQSMCFICVAQLHFV